MPLFTERRPTAPRLHSARLDLIACTGALAPFADAPAADLDLALGCPVARDWLNDEARFLIGYYADWALADPSQVGWGLYFLRERAQRVIIGSAGLKGKPDWHGVIEIGYGVAPAFQRRGYATEAARTLVEWAFRQPRVQRLAAECLTSNHASRRVLQNLGMHYTGTDGEYERWILDR